MSDSRRWTQRAYQQAVTHGRVVPEADADATTVDLRRQMLRQFSELTGVLFDARCTSSCVTEAMGAFLADLALVAKSERLDIEDVFEQGIVARETQRLPPPPEPVERAPDAYELRAGVPRA